ncbi:phosphoribosylaminoimidazolesuccinocarboxamide synthase [Oscillospiraceae bacterium HV4-5-C5C]|nr:phosphoribosylaminoimidazolesuccinocarboxamide synthase [Oscillospiraceae bacterium HV4-5-C5C]
MHKLLGDTSFITLPRLSSGKVREMYDLGDCLLMVVTDRISAFDVVFDQLVPDKGRVLSGISAFWFNYLQSVLPNHLLTTDPAAYPQETAPWRELLEGRSMLVKKARMLPVECIVRAYLDGSALKEYRACGTVAGETMPAGLRQGDPLPRLLFTPSTKEESGHDRNITREELANLIGRQEAELLADRSLALFAAAQAHAEAAGIILADSKFEFGHIDGELVVADELFTPDSSRFWDRKLYRPGAPQASFDKQYLRDYLETLDWDKTYPAPTLPQEIILKTATRYREAYERLTGHALAE